MRRPILLVLLVSCVDASPATTRRDCRETEPATSLLRPVQAVEPVYSMQTGKNGPSHRLLGAAVLVEPQAGVSREYLQRRIDCCHPDEASPLGVPGAHAIVTSRGGSYRVAITSDDDDGAQEILRRADALPR